MDTKAAFEKWATDNGFSIQFYTDNNEYSHASTRNAFRGFTGGRETIEIELPDPDMWGDEQSVQEYSEMTEQSLQAIGIRIKGKTE